MLTGLLLSFVVFFVSAYFLHRYLEDWGLDKGMARTLIVLVVASVISYGAESLYDHFTGSKNLLDSAIQMQQQIP